MGEETEDAASIIVADDVDDGGDLSEDIFLSVLVQDRRIGAAVYDAGEAAVLYLESEEDDRLSILETLLFQVNPSMVVTSGGLKRNELFCKVLAGGNDGEDWDVESEQEITNHSPKLRKAKSDRRKDVVFLSASDFGIQTALNRISLLRLPDMPAQMTAQERIAFLGSCIDQDQTLGVRALGGLISFLVRRHVAGDRTSEPDPFLIQCVRPFSLEGFMLLTPQALLSLQIFQKDVHPLMHGSGNSKEGHSLFGIMNRTKSAPGARLLRSWFCRPLLNLEEITERQNAVALLKSPQLNEVTDALAVSLRGIGNLGGVIHRLRTFCASVNDWRVVAQGSLSILRTFELCERVPILRRARVFREIIEVLPINAIKTLAGKIEDVIDFPTSKSERRISIKQGFSSDLDELRDAYSSLDDFLTMVGMEELRRISQIGSAINKLQCLYYPQIGYMLSVQKDCIDEMDLSEASLDRFGLSLSFSSEIVHYLKSQRMEELDRDLGDIHGAIVDKEACILREVEAVVFPLLDCLLPASMICAELDCLMSLAYVSREYEWSCPSLTALREHHITGGRHPLQELTVPSFIANDTHLRGGSVALVTGPNYSGKSVYIKQVALIVFLAHLGSDVPAISASIGITDRIMTRIQSFESVSTQMSSFFIDCSQVAFILRNCTSRSLVILDEFGKGTDGMDGTSLLASVIQASLSSDEEYSPNLMVSTHFTELITLKLLPSDSSRLSLYSMEVRRDDATSSSDQLPGNELIFMYRLCTGHIAAESFALHCALRAGVPRRVLQRVVQVQDAMKEGTVPGQNEIDIRLKESMQRAKHVATAFLGLDLDDRDAIQLFMSNL